MKISKKGAIEFSMTTIIIIIIGVAILALALPWIARTMGQASEITDTAFSAAKEQLRTRVGPSNPLVVSPEDVTIKTGEQKLITVAWYNDGANSVNNPSLTIEGPRVLFDVPTSFTSPGSINAGDVGYWKIIVEPKPTTSEGFESYSLRVTANGKNYNKPLSIIME